MHNHRYIIETTGEPLESCPKCGNDLTSEKSVSLSFSIAGKVVDDLFTCLDEDGYLVDLEGNPIASGHLGGVMCGNCGEQLEDLPGVVDDDTPEVAAQKNGTIVLPCYGIVLNYNENGGTIASKLRDGDDDTAELKVAYDVIESFVLACVCAGIDVSRPAFLEALETVVDKAVQKYGD